MKAKTLAKVPWRCQLADLPSRRAFVSQLGLLALGAGGAWYLRDRVLWGPPAVEFAAGAAETGWLPFDNTRGVIIVEARANGASLKALVDSGAQASAIDLPTVQALGLPLSSLAPIIAFGVSGAPQIGRATRLEVVVGELMLHGLKAAAVELGPISQAGVSLILGQDVLQGVILDIDFPNARVAFRRREGFEPPAGAVSPPARRANRQLLTTVELGATPLELVVDTGASSAVALSAAAAKRVGVTAEVAGPSIPSIVFGGLSHDRMGTLARVRFAGESFDDVPVQLLPAGPQARLPTGLLGLGLLQGSRVLFDMGGGRLHLLPSSPERRRDGRTRAHGRTRDRSRPFPMQR